MATLLLLRHGRTTANSQGVLAGDLPVELDAAGVAQAHRVGARLAGLPLAAVVTSPLRRCRQTLDLAIPQVSFSVERRLSECGYGDWSGRPLRELAEEPLWSVVQRHPSSVVFPRGEAMAAMSARAVAAVREWDAKVTAEHGPQAIWLACSHGDVIKSIVADALGLHLDQFQRITVEPGSITVIRYSPHRPFLLHLNDTGDGLASLIPPAAPPDDPAAAVPTGSDAPVGGGA